MKMMMETKHISLIKESFWPLTASLSSFFLVVGMIFFMHFSSIFLLFLSVLTMILSVSQWSRDFIRESSFFGGHNSFFQILMKSGMLLFILSEVLFFFSFFWGFFHSSLSPCLEIGSKWPPLFLTAIPPLGVPLLNTIILLTSGVSVTWSHLKLQMSEIKEASISLLFTCFLGWIFLLIQISEYSFSEFSFNDSVYGSIFFMATGFHGLHVFLGSLLLSTMGVRLLMNHLSNFHHIGYEASIWYWHFVDVVWLFLFCFVYLWGF